MNRKVKKGAENSEDNDCRYICFLYFLYNICVDR